jgi:hypothetical protein
MDVTVKNKILFSKVALSEELHLHILTLTVSFQ